MKKKYRLLHSSTNISSTLYNAYEVGEGNDKKISLIFFNEDLEKYGLYEDLEYNVTVFNKLNHPHIL